MVLCRRSILAQFACIINSLSTVIEMLINLPHKISHTLFNLINEDYIKNKYRIDNIMNREMNSENTNTSKILNTKFTPIKTSTIGFNNIGLNTIQSYCKNNKNFSNNVINFPRVFSTITNDYTNSYNKNSRDNNINNNNKKTKVKKIKDPYKIETTDAKQKILKNPNQELNPEISKELKQEINQKINKNINQEMNQEKNQKKLQKHEQNNYSISKISKIEKQPEESKNKSNNSVDNLANMLFRKRKDNFNLEAKNICNNTNSKIKTLSFVSKLELGIKNKDKNINLF